MIQVHTVPARQDNLCYLITREGSRDAISIDPADGPTISQALKERGFDLKFILNTHHHHDHVGGNILLSEEYGCPIYCSKVDLDLARIPGASPDSKISRGLVDSDQFNATGIQFRVLSIPGHTQGQIAFHIEESDDLFSGDTVFAMGCGRLFEGTPGQMLASLQRIAKLPVSTRIRFGHEYTLRNAQFAKQFEPSNREIDLRVAKSEAAFAQGNLSPSSSVADELKVNPFFRTTSPEIRASLKKLDGAEYNTDLQVLSRLRELRNTF